MCLLALIAEEPSYGYRLAAELKRRGLPLVGEGSIYPVLSRMLRSGLVESYLAEVPGSGPPRKYYRISEEGRRRLEIWRAEWNDLARGVTAVLDRSGS